MILFLLAYNVYIVHFVFIYLNNIPGYKQSCKGTILSKDTRESLVCERRQFARCGG